MANNNSLMLGNFIWDRTTHYLRPSPFNDNAEKQETIKLTNKQKALLCCLVDAHPKPLIHSEIVQKVWGDTPTSSESLPQLISRTRHRLNDKEKNILVNVTGVGYSLNFETLSQEPTSQPHTEPNNTSLRGLGEKQNDTSKQNNRLWQATLLAVLLLTVFNLYETAKAVYYKHDFEQVLKAEAYPEIKRSDDGKVIVTINNHECIYNKVQLLLQCP